MVAGRHSVMGTTPGGTSGRPPNRSLTWAWLRGTSAVGTKVLYASTAAVTGPGAKSVVRWGITTKLPGASRPASRGTTPAGSSAAGRGKDGRFRPRPGHHLRPRPHPPLRHFPVGRVMVLAAQPVAVHPGRMRHQGIKPGAWINGVGARHRRLRAGEI